MKVTAAEKADERAEKNVRRLLDLPSCFCSKGLACPEISTALAVGHPNEAAAERIMQRYFARQIRSSRRNA
jgi:hypothetical protein